MRSAYVVLALAVAGISLAAPLIRLSEAHPLAIATWRLFFSMLIVLALLVPGRGWRQWRRLSPRGVALAAAGGLMLALHFWSWNASLRLTSLSASVLLVNLQPVIVAVVSALWLGESPSSRQWGGIALAVAGAAVVAGADLAQTLGAAAGHALRGDLLALAGALTAALYFLIGRRLRQSLDLWPYVALVYGACFVALLGLSLAARVPLIGQPPRELLIFAGLAVGPMMLGHTGMNWALRHLPAYVVNLTTLGEPVGATLLAAVLPGIREVPGPATLAGGAVILAGLLLARPRGPEAALATRGGRGAGTDRPT